MFAVLSEGEFENFHIHQHLSFLALYWGFGKVSGEDKTLPLTKTLGCRQSICSSHFFREEGSYIRTKVSLTLRPSLHIGSELDFIGGWLQMRWNIKVSKTWWESLQNFKIFWICIFKLKELKDIFSLLGFEKKNIIFHSKTRFIVINT